MNEWWLLLVLPVGAYLVGSIPFCFLAGKASGVDLRTEGTGNPGAGNLRRVVGFPAALTAGLLDGFKGLFVVLALLGKVPDAVLVVTALATVVGHNWSIFLGFRSGRGLATAAGVVLAISPLLLLWPSRMGNRRMVDRGRRRRVHRLDRSPLRRRLGRRAAGGGPGDRRTRRAHPDPPDAGQRRCRSRMARRCPEDGLRHRPRREQAGRLRGAAPESRWLQWPAWVAPGGGRLPSRRRLSRASEPGSRRST